MPDPLAPPWHTDFAQTSPLFAPIQAAIEQFASRTAWPTLDQLNTALASRPARALTRSSHAVRFVPQDTRAQTWTDKYEPRIFLRGEIQTREANWHDFFNAMVWMTFPRTKAALNALQYEQYLAAQRTQQKNRTAAQDALTIFDEGGAIVVSRDPTLLERIARYEWKQLFWAERRHVERDMRVFLFGHALYEKALTPYKGMTAKCLLLTVTDDFLALTLPDQLSRVDERSANWFHATGGHLRTTALSPLPILGVPGWTPENIDPSFYDDKQYFRDQYAHSTST